jgi:hypothetical protein
MHVQQIAYGAVLSTAVIDWLSATCIPYSDSKRLFIETVICNRGHITVRRPVVEVRVGPRALPQIYSSRAANEVHAAAARNFVPAPTGVGSPTKRPVFDPVSIEQQRSRHIQFQEQEELLASLLLTVADDLSLPDISPRRSIRPVRCSTRRRQAPRSKWSCVLRATNSASRLYAEGHRCKAVKKSGVFVDTSRALLYAD